MRHETARAMALHVRECSRLTSADYRRESEEEARRVSLAGVAGILLILILFAAACLLGAHVSALVSTQQKEATK